MITYQKARYLSLKLINLFRLACLQSIPTKTEIYKAYEKYINAFVKGENYSSFSFAVDYLSRKENKDVSEIYQNVIHHLAVQSINHFCDICGKIEGRSTSSYRYFVLALSGKTDIKPKTFPKKFNKENFSVFLDELQDLGENILCGNTFNIPGFFLEGENVNEMIDNALKSVYFPNIVLWLKRLYDPDIMNL